MSSMKTVKIERRGNFDDDTFFGDSWTDWHAAMKDVIDRWEKGTSTGRKSTAVSASLLPASEVQSIYRQIRSLNVTADKSQAISCTEEDNRFRLVVDVKDFNLENLSVKAVDETIVVEGVIEKDYRNSMLTEKYLRKFLLPPGVNMSKVTSALSRDGILTIYAPKEVPSKRANYKDNPDNRTVTTVTTRTPTGKQVKVYRNYAAGKPTCSDDGPFNPTGGGATTTRTYRTPDGLGGYTETTYMSRLPERKPHTVWTTTSDTDCWTSLDASPHRSYDQTKDINTEHSLKDDGVSSYLRPNTITQEPLTYRNTVGNGSSSTQKEQRQWNDEPSPGLNRQNKTYYESSQMKDSFGNIIGSKKREELESNAEGEREDYLPDGSKRKIFTKCYDNQNSYKSFSFPTKTQ